jgi:c-di-GMP-binding flagellar brake protein YcgR
MENLFKSFKRLRPCSRQERRKHPRYDFITDAYYMVQGSWYKGSIQDISEGGAYIRSIQDRTFSLGEDILLVVQLKVLREQLRGKIIRMGSHGMAVEFQTSELHLW